MSAKDILCCKYCSKIYKKQSFYEKHVLLCERLYDVKRLKNDEILPNPSITDLYKMINVLTDKYNSVHGELQRIKNQLNIRNKKINVLSWLNTSCKMNENFFHVVENFKIQRCQLEYVFDHNYIEGVMQIFLSLFPSFDTNENTGPVRCFQQKRGIFYIHDDSEWSEITKEQFNSVISKINKEILLDFNAWRVENQDKLQNIDFQDTFNKNIEKVLGDKLDFPTRVTKIKNKLYQTNTQCFKNMVEIQLE